MLKSGMIFDTSVLKLGTAIQVNGLAYLVRKVNAVEINVLGADNKITKVSLDDVHKGKVDVKLLTPVVKIEAI
jgi:hypothetical protein